MNNSNIINKIQKDIGYKFKNLDLLMQAFTRRTYSAENGGQDNEVLEFIGDKALDFAVVKILIERYGKYAKEGQFDPVLNEGDYTEIKKKLVEKDTLASRIEKLGYYNYLIMGKGDVKIDVKDDKSVREDLFEAIVGAVTIDSNWNFETIIKVVNRMLCPEDYLDDNDDGDKDNYISLVQEWVQKKNGVLPEYQVNKEDGGYVAFLTIDGVKKKFIGKGKSMKSAKSKAAQFAYAYLQKNDMLPTMKNAIRTIQYDKVVNQLQELAQKKYISMPEYIFEELPCLTGGKNWLCKCHIESEGIDVEKIGTAKTESRKNAAEEVLRILQKKYNK